MTFFKAFISKMEVQPCYKYAPQKLINPVKQTFVKIYYILFDTIASRCLTAKNRNLATTLIISGFGLDIKKAIFCFSK